MIVVYCDICGGKIGEEDEAEPFHVKLWKGNNIYGFSEVCPLCEAKIKNYIDDLKEGEE